MCFKPLSGASAQHGAGALATAIGQGEVIYLKDVSHIPHIEAPEAFMAALPSLLQEMC